VECALDITKNTLECLKWSTIGYYMYWLTKFTAWARSGWVIVFFFFVFFWSPAPGYGLPRLIWWSPRVACLAVAGEATNGYCCIHGDSKPRPRLSGTSCLPLEPTPIG
jgi:hypothetical protein